MCASFVLLTAIIQLSSVSGVLDVGVASNKIKAGSSESGGVGINVPKNLVPFSDDFHIGSEEEKDVRGADHSLENGEGTVNIGSFKLRSSARYDGSDTVDNLGIQSVADSRLSVGAEAIVSLGNQETAVNFHAAEEGFPSKCVGQGLKPRSFDICCPGLELKGLKCAKKCSVRGEECKKTEDCCSVRDVCKSGICTQCVVIGGILKEGKQCCRGLKKSGKLCADCVGLRDQCCFQERVNGECYRGLRCRKENEPCDFDETIDVLDRHVCCDGLYCNDLDSFGHTCNSRCVEMFGSCKFHGNAWGFKSHRGGCCSVKQDKTQIDLRCIQGLEKGYQTCLPCLRNKLKGVNGQECCKNTHNDENLCGEFPPYRNPFALN